MPVSIFTPVVSDGDALLKRKQVYVDLRFASEYHVSVMERIRVFWALSDRCGDKNI